MVTRVVRASLLAGRLIGMFLYLPPVLISATFFLTLALFSRRCLAGEVDPDCPTVLGTFAFACTESEGGKDLLYITPSVPVSLTVITNGVTYNLDAGTTYTFVAESNTICEFCFRCMNAS